MKQRKLIWILRAFVFLVCCFSFSQASADVFQDIPEAKKYKLMYTLDIPERASYFSALPKYSVDNAKTFKGTFSRIAYYLSLQPKIGKRRYVYVSMDAFTLNVQQVGVPSGVLKVKFQQKVKNMNVFSNVTSLKTGTGIQTGNIEFWSTNYVTQNGAGIPGANVLVYDFGDLPVVAGSYGSMQVHNYGAKQTLFAYNNWGSNRFADLGIGNNIIKHTNGVIHSDWTFRGNVQGYTKRTLQVLVLPGKPPSGLAIQIKQPLPHQVIQRQPGNFAMVKVEGVLQTTPDEIQARVISIQGGKTTNWTTIVSKPTGKAFSGSLKVPAGWYKLQVRLMEKGKQVDMKEVQPFGVGEVFIICGQSNSANHGSVKTKASDPRVSNFGHGRWVHAEDPMLVATGAKGSPWPTFGDILAKKWGVPIGILSVGVGGTRVDQWQPTGNLFPRLATAVKAVGKNGARAVLWHQGESDAAARTSTANYVKRFNTIIQSSRKEAGWDIPWYIALVSFLPNLTKKQMQDVINGQKQVIAGHSKNFEGPTTDDLLGVKWRYDRVHFNLAGLKEHALRWTKRITLPACKGFGVGSNCEPIPEPNPEPIPEPGPEEIPNDTVGSGEKGLDAGPGETGVLEIVPEPAQEKNPEPIVDTGATESAPNPEITAPEKSEINEKPGANESPTVDSSVNLPSEPIPDVARPNAGGCGCQMLDVDTHLSLIFMMVFAFGFLVLRLRRIS